jgi:hypothetical protein
MPDARGNFKGQGWSRTREEGWQRVFGPEMRAHDHDWGCRHPVDARQFESHSGMPYCEVCGADLD